MIKMRSFASVLLLTINSIRVHPKPLHFCFVVKVSYFCNFMIWKHVIEDYTVFCSAVSSNLLLNTTLSGPYVPGRSCIFYVKQIFMVPITFEHNLISRQV